MYFLSVGRSLSRRFSALVLGLACLWLLGCAPRVTTRVDSSKNPIPISHVAVYAFTVQFGDGLSMSYEKTVDMVNAALAPNRFQVYSYGDFQLFTLDNTGLYEGKTLLSVIKHDQIPLEGLMVMKGGVQLRPEAQALVPQREDGKRDLNARLPVTLYIELYHYQQQLPIVRLDMDLTLDPLDARDGDRFPSLTHAVRQLSTRAIELAMRRGTVPAPHFKLPFEYYADHSLLFRIATDDNPSLARFMLTQDEIEGDMALLEGYQYFYPSITLLEVQRLNNSPGLLVKKVGAPWLSEQGLQEGDLILKVNDEDIRAAHQLDRVAARLEPGQQLPMTIVRKGELKDLLLTRP